MSGQQRSRRRIGRRRILHTHADRLRQQLLQRAVAELEVLNEIGRAISAQLRLGQTLETIYQQASRLIDTSNFYIALFDGEHNTISFPIATERGERQDWPQRPWSHGLTELVLERRTPLLIRSHEEIKGHYDIIRHGLGSESWLGVPIMLGDQPLGVITVQDPDKDYAFDDRDRELLVTIASHAAVAIANARHFRRIEEELSIHLAELEVLEAVVRDINATLELGDVLARLVARAVEAVSANAGMLALRDPASEQLLLMASLGYPESDVVRNGRVWDQNVGIIGRVARTRQAVLLTDVHADPDYCEGRPDTTSQMTVPIMRGEDLLGVLALESDRDDVFNVQRLRFMRQLAEHAAIAITNARTFAEADTQRRLLQVRSAQLAEVLRVSRALSANLQLEDLLPEVVRAVHSSLGFNIAILSLYEPGPPPIMRRRASAGLPMDDWLRLRDELVPLEWYSRAMREEFRISHSYFIAHNHQFYDEVWDDSPGGHYRPDLGERQENEWHPDDSLFVPLHDAGGNLLGSLSVDDPFDRRIPSRETIQLLEIFASQASIAIENANRFAESQLLAHTDSLTGLFNHRHFNTTLQHEIEQSRRTGHPLALLALDIDHFKRYNDEFGHLEGNTLLRELAMILRQTIRKGDIPARVGGEEFVVILPNAELPGALAVAERLREAIASYPFPRRQVTVSIGVACFQSHMDAEALHDAADAALYAAKRAGRNRTVVEAVA